MNPGQTRVSVVMPAFNGEKYIASAIASCLNQFADNDELIVVDNASTDDTARIVRDYPDHRIKYHFESRKGVAAARNKGLRHVQGAFVAFLDCDDLWPDGRQEALMGLLDAHPAVDACYGRIRLLFDNPDTSRSALLDGALTPIVLLAPFLFRRKIIEQIGEMDETLPSAEDGDYLIRMQEADARLLSWDGDALIYRQHETNMTLKREQFKSGQLGALARKIHRNRTKPT